MAMTINLTQIKLRDLFDGYVNSDEDGVIGYHGRLDIRPISLRTFDDKIKRKICENQNHKCPFCDIHKDGHTYPDGKTEYKYDEMEGDHVVPWSQGGKTEENNCQMLCKWHNGHKSAN